MDTLTILAMQTFGWYLSLELYFSSFCDTNAVLEDCKWSCDDAHSTSPPFVELPDYTESVSGPGCLGKPRSNLLLVEPQRLIDYRAFSVTPDSPRHRKGSAQLNIMDNYS